MTQPQHLLRRNLTLLRFLKVDQWILIGAVVVAYQMHDVGLSLAQVLTGEAIFAASVLIFEIPSGVFSDVMSRKTTMILGTMLIALAYALFTFAHNFSDIIAAQIAAGLGVATISGTDSALLYDTLKALGREQEHKKILSSFTSFRLFLAALGTVIGGILGSIYLRLPVQVGIILPLLHCTLSFFLTDPPRERSEYQDNLLLHTKEAVRWLFSYRFLLILLVGNMILMLGFKIGNHTFNPFMELIGIPVYYWGIILSGFMLSESLIAHFAHRLMDCIGEHGSFLLLFVLQLTAFLLMAMARIPMAWIFPILIYISWPLRDIFMNDAINKRTHAGRRATVLSMASFAGQGLQALTLPLLGIIATGAGLGTLYIAMAWIVGGVGIVTVSFLHQQRE